MSAIPPLSFKYLTTIPAYRIVTLVTSTANTVKVPASSAEMPLGITKDTVLDTALSGPVICAGGIAKLQFNETMACGKLVSSDSAGLGTPYVDASAGSYFVGMLVGPTIALTGAISEVLVMPGWKDLP